ncbi:HNH endonuclease [Pseudomonas aeruginosa]|uniref:HNH endonuclease signature motif containing protein n=1 Tax=Pseudomonas aeruginosa TaxID=287 RepID=UPI001C1F9A88|nr:HNH endonuclease signature motif containing protein [Pseudomonas aeruginosa]MBU8410830.1 HNH endonuclease [Pseudomonas aeruginosa]MCO2553696.1 HNH endonuclease [Pseudomonas aeruginosa]HBO1420011.1 HNH endonuclease [Pseudomonas aeruginosa]HBO4477893.1 HNH endonuclease [Pseudomonas aeruginosa]HCK5076569.1 HNH endonuclease [Pseudomonas aeruginosa]
MQPNRRVPNSIKRLLLEEAGGKCANPGCANSRVEYHHIKEWAVFKSHNQKDMIAICPVCHDAVHYGNLKITEKTLYEWKNIVRSPGPIRSNFYIEPGVESKVILGSISFSQNSPRQTTIFSLSDEQYLKFEVKDEFLNISTQIIGRDAQPLIRITNNNITANASNQVKVERPHPGRFRVTAPANITALPAYAIFKMRKVDKEFLKSGIATLLDIAVIKPGVVKLEGFWIKKNTTIISSGNCLSIVDLYREAPISFFGEGEKTVLVYTGPIDQAILDFGQS